MNCASVRVEEGRDRTPVDVVAEHEGRGNEAPRDHDPGDPDARPDLLQDHVARHFEDEVADEEDARAEPVDRVAELQVVRHLQLGESDVDAVQERDDVAQEQEGDQARCGLLVRGLLELPCDDGRHWWLLPLSFWACPCVEAAFKRNRNSRLDALYETRSLGACIARHLYTANCVGSTVWPGTERETIDAAVASYDAALPPPQPSPSEAGGGSAASLSPSEAQRVMPTTPRMNA